MAFDQTTRNRLARFVSDTRTLLTEEFTRQLQNEYGLDPASGEVTPIERLSALDDSQRETARILRETLDYYLAGNPKADAKAFQDVLDRIVREQAFTVLNRLCALRMSEARGLVLETVSKCYQSKGFLLYARLAGSALGETGEAYRSYLFSIMDEFAVDLPVLFDRFSPQGRLFPREAALLKLLELINDPEIEPLWTEDETIGWVYQYFNSKEERKAMRDASQAPRNSRELAVRNQFFTPRYVVEFLTDNTLGHIWYEMTRSETILKDTCRYLVRRPNEKFLDKGEEAPKQHETKDNLSQEELLHQPVYIPNRPLKDPREIRMLDPACGSMHFGLYAFDLFEQIYTEAWNLEELLGEDALLRLSDLEPLHKTYSDKEAYLRDVPRLIIERNIHGVDIDPRAVQIAGLSLWLRAEKSWQSQGLKPSLRPQIRSSNVVCAEPMPGDRQMLEDFLATLREDKLEALMRKTWHVPTSQKIRATKQMADAIAKLVRTVWQEMELAGDAGSLLKIEDTLHDAIATARTESEEKSPLFRVLEFGLNDPTKEQYVQLITGEDQNFFDRAEGLVLAALREFTEQAVNSDNYRRRLFAGDAVLGFAFINLCQLRYDVAVMNPPFGEVVPSITGLLENYGKKNNDISALFLKRALSFLNELGLCGVIGPRSLFFLQSNEEIRTEVLLNNTRLCLAADLGLRVMDSAWIEAIAFVFGNNPSGISRFYRLLDSMEKEKDLQNAIRSNQTSIIKDIPTRLFSQYPFKSISYWLPQTYLGLFNKKQSIETIYGTIKQGLATSDDYRYLRLWAECPYDSIYEIYYPFGKGGEYSPFFGIPEVMVFWREDGKGYWCDTSSNTGLPRSNIWMLKETINSFFLRPGITYTQRTNSAFSPRVLPKNCIFATKGETIFCNDPDDLMFILGITQSRPFQALIEAFVANGDSTQSEGAARSYISGLIKRLPFPQANQNLKNIVSEITMKIVKIKRQIYFMDETGQLFIHPFIFCQNFKEKTISEINCDIQLKFLQQDATVLELSYQLNKEAEKLYGLTSNDINFLDATLGKHPQEYIDHVVPDDSLIIFAKTDDEMLKQIRENGITGRIFVNQSYHSSRKIEVISHLSQCKGTGVIKQLISKKIKSKFEEKSFAISVISYLFGIAVGRWNIDSLNIIDINIDENPFDSLPQTSPGLQIIQKVDKEREFLFGKNIGVWCEEPGLANDIVNQLIYFMKYIWGNKADNNEQELCDILGVSTIRKYINNPGLFFSDHVKRYSKSRRAAPIYWPLSTSSSSYTLWLYYQSLNDQTLYTCVNDFVDPKLKQVSEEAARLRLKKSRSATDEKELERLTDFERELKDFREELLRVAKFWKPNLNDGVEITAAPLWKFFQHKPWQKRLRETWQKLEAGEYDWAHLAYSIWPERIREKCKTDKSLAIAHDLESLYVEPPVSAKKKKAKKQTSDEESERWFNDD